MLVLFNKISEGKEPNFIDYIILSADIEKKLKKLWDEYCEVKLTTFYYEDTTIIPPKEYVAMDKILDEVSNILKHKKDKRVQDLVSFLERENLLEGHELKKIYIANLKEKPNPYVFKKRYLDETYGVYKKFLYEYLR